MGNKKSLGFLIVFLTLLSCFSGHGQEKHMNFGHAIDSMDRIQPKTYKRVRPHGPICLIKISGQNQFDNLNEDINQAIAAGNNNVKVVISKGIYSFRENHIYLKNIINGDVSLTIEGRDAVITSFTGNDTQLKPDTSWTIPHQANKLIEIEDSNIGLYHIPYPCDRALIDGQYNKVQITQWYNAPIYTVHHISKRGIFFICPKTKEISYNGRKGINLNADYIYSGEMPFFRLCNSNRENLYKSRTFFRAKNCVLKTITMSGIKFVGNKVGEALITMSKIESEQILFQSCSFHEIKSGVAFFEETNNVCFDRNTIIDTYGNEIVFSKGCNDVRVTNNTFNNCGREINNKLCVTCTEAQYYIANNVFKDFGRTAIGVGAWYGTKKNKPSRGIIEHNEIYFTPSYLKEKKYCALMDGGAIYVWTQNDDVIIRYNYIHDYEGRGGNRGIFCDDGASNMKIYGNIIFNIPNSYSIAARLEHDQKPYLHNNANNLIAFNIVDNNILFSGYDKEARNSVKGANFIVIEDKKSLFKNKYYYLTASEDDIILMNSYYKNGRLILSKESKGILNKHFTSDRYINKILKKIRKRNV